MRLPFDTHNGEAVVFSPMKKFWAFHSDFKIDPSHVTRAWLGMPKSVE